MAHHFQWLVEERVLYVHFTGRLGIEELEVFITRQHELIHTTTQLVHFINDSRHLDGMDFNLKMLQTFSRSLQRPDHFGWHLDIIPGAINRMFASLAGQFAGSRNRQFSTLEEAFAFLWHNDSTLPEIDNQALIASLPVSGG